MQLPERSQVYETAIFDSRRWDRFVARPGDVSLELFDIAGRRVRTLARGVLAPGPHTTVWDGRDGAGHAVGAGVYFVRLVTPAGAFDSRIVSLR